MPVKLLHISDIHFYPHSEGGNDPDAPYRDALVEKVRQSSQSAPFDCIFVTGDIAYSGKPQEYEVALGWLRNLARIAKCGDSALYVVPGNHDIDRAIAKTNTIAHDVQSTIANCKGEQLREKALQKALADPEIGPSLFRPLSEYNKFAAQLQCEVGPPEHGVWMRYLPIGEGYRLKVFGVTSVLCSSSNPPGDDDLPRHNLYVGPFQAAFRSSQAEIVTVLMHHPPDWLLDNDEQTRHLKNRARLHFLGHKHSREVDIAPTYVRFGAGAVSPNRHERQFEPGFNIIDLTVQKNAKGHELKVAAEVWTWQENPGRFRLHQDHNGEEIWSATLHLPPIPQDDEPMVADRLPPPAPSQEPGGGPEAQRFWSLTSTAKKNIVRDLDLLTEDERALPERYRYANIFSRAARDGKLNQLNDAIRAAWSRT